MSDTRGIAASIAFAVVAAVGFAAPAHADDFSGTYDLNFGADNVATWTITPCGGEPFIPCVQVAQTGGKMQPWNGEADLSVGKWTMVVDRPDAIGCADGKTFPALTTYSWDAVTLSGWVSVYNNGVCGGEPRTLSAPFTLTKVA